MGETASRSYDAIVVGTGPGGATVARELARSGKRVVMVEWGSNAPVTGKAGRFLAAAGIPGKGLLITNRMLAMFRGITTGGSSLFFYATAFDPPLDMLRSYGLDIGREVEEAKQELPIAPLKDELVGPMAKRIMSAALDLGYDWRKLPKFVYQDRCRPNCWRCNYGCPFGAKWSARMWVEEAVGHGARLETRAKVERVLVEGSHATGVEFRRRGRRERLYADTVVVSAGGIGSPMILRASGLLGAGYRFFFDPLIAVMGTVDDLRGGREFPMAAGVLMEEEGYLMTDMTIPALLYAGFTAEVFRFHKLAAHPRTLQIMIKAKDSLGGRLTKRGGLRKRLSREDEGKLLKGYERARKILERAGARDIFKTWYVATHPGATVKVGELVDANLKTEIDGLYVCDCSVIPEAWGLPPTLTLIGLGKRLAKHLLGVETSRETAMPEPPLAGGSIAV
ncbi:MAG: GMC family oxidoreductase [Candidatus Dadabacteria bacterium]|nr:MAG: GMC family oxidoreductase [Candidatus Dadabacteria bacterium]